MLELHGADVEGRSSHLVFLEEHLWIAVVQPVEDAQHSLDALLLVAGRCLVRQAISHIVCGRGAHVAAVDQPLSHDEVAVVRCEVVRLRAVLAL